MTPEELGRIAYEAWANSDVLNMQAWENAALAVAAAVKREDAAACKEIERMYDKKARWELARGAESCANAILATIPEGK